MTERLQPGFSLVFNQRKSTCRQVIHLFRPWVKEVRVRKGPECISVRHFLGTTFRLSSSFPVTRVQSNLWFLTSGEAEEIKMVLPTLGSLSYICYLQKACKLIFLKIPAISNGFLTYSHLHLFHDQLLALPFEGKLPENR